MKLIPFFLVPPKKTLIQDSVALVVSILIIFLSILLAKYIHKGFLIIMVFPIPFIFVYGLKNLMTIYRAVMNAYLNYGPYHDFIKVLQESGYEYYDIDHDNALIEKYDHIFEHAQKRSSRRGLVIKVIFSHKDGSQIGLGRYTKGRNEHITKNDVYFLLPQKPNFNDDIENPFISGFYLEIVDGQNILHKPEVFKKLINEIVQNNSAIF